MWYLSLLPRMPPPTHCTSPPSPSRRPCVGSPLTGAHVMILETTHQYGDALAWRRVGVPTQILPGDKADPCLATQKCRPEVTTSYAEKVTGTSGRKWYHALVLNRIVATASGGRWLTHSPPPLGRLWGRVFGCKVLAFFFERYCCAASCPRPGSGIAPPPLWPLFAYPELGTQKWPKTCC